MQRGRRRAWARTGGQWARTTNGWATAALGAAAPVPRRVPHVIEAHGDARVDDWYWLRERENPEVLAHLEAENRYTDTMLAHLTELRDRLFDEIRSRVQETDVGAPARKGGFEYYSRTREGLQYGIHCRRPVGAPSPPDPEAEPGTEAGEQVLLDENLTAVGHAFFALGAFAVTDDARTLAYSTDLDGSERYTLRFRDLGTGMDADDEIREVAAGAVWANDDRTVFYLRHDEAMRPWQVWRHTLGTPVDADVLVFQEDDDRFYLGLDKTRTHRYLVVASHSKTTSEVRLVDADDPSRAPRVVAPREEGVEYHVEHHRSPDADVLYVLTNADGAENFKLAVTPVPATGRSSWRDVIAHRPDVRIDDLDVFAGHLVVSERHEGLSRLRVLAVRGGVADRTGHVVEMPETVASVWTGANLEYDARVARLEYTSFVTPRSAYDYDLDRRTLTLVKRTPVRGHDPERYETERLWATATDGTRVPLSVVHRRGLSKDGRNPLLLYGYGSYEISIDPTFSASRLSLLDRGVVFAVAHVRGGGELGRWWYEQGKLHHKWNTFTDFIACAEHLVTEGYTSPDRVVARGGSAGGLLMGAVANTRPDLFRAIVAEVPFVDCVTTILDESLPLTITEWEEWGNPVADAASYEYIKSYSPYDNVGEKPYPAILVTSGLNDQRVQFWEPAKWVAKLRATKTDNRPVLLKMEMGAGHAGLSGRYDAWRDEAFVLTFALDQLGLADRRTA